MSEITDVNFKPDAEPEVNELPHRFRIPDATREKLFEVAKTLGELWCGLNSDSTKDSHDPDDQWWYRGGVILLTFRGGFTDGWVDLTYNQVITDIFYGHRWYHQHKTWDDVEAELKKDKEKREAERQEEMEQ